MQLSASCQCTASWFALFTVIKLTQEFSLFLFLWLCYTEGQTTTEVCHSKSSGAQTKKPQMWPQFVTISRILLNEIQNFRAHLLWLRFAWKTEMTIAAWLKGFTKVCPAQEKKKICHRYCGCCLPKRFPCFICANLEMRGDASPSPPTPLPVISLGNWSWKVEADATSNCLSECKHCFNMDVVMRCERHSIGLIATGRRNR